MRQKEISLNIRPLKPLPADDAGDDHAGSAADTPMRPDAFDMSDEEKISKIERSRLWQMYLNNMPC